MRGTFHCSTSLFISSLNKARSDNILNDMEAWGDQKTKNITKNDKKIPFDESKKPQHHHHKSDIFHVLTPISYLSKICGLLPVKFTPNKDDKYSGTLDFKQVFYGFSLAFILTGAQCWGLYRDIRDGWQNSTRLFSKIAITVTCGDVFFVIGVTSLAILGSPMRWRHLQRALDKIIEADIKLDVPTNCNIRKLSVVMIATTLGYLFVISIVDYISWGIVVAGKNNYKYDDKGPINYSPLYLMYVVVVALQMQYAVVLMILGQRLVKLNRIIENLTRMNCLIDYFKKDMGLAAQERRREISRELSDQTRQKRSIGITGSMNFSEGTICGKAASETIDHLTIIHHILCDSIVHLNKAFGVILMMCTLSCLMHLIITFYFAYAEVNSSSSRWYILSRQTFWIIFHLWKMMLFVQPPYLVASEARNTGSLVSQALASDWNPAAQKQLERFAMQLLHRPAVFTACGLFHLDRGLITSIAGAVTTYLVILVQFQNYEDKEARELLLNATKLLTNVSGIEET